MACLGSVNQSVVALSNKFHNTNTQSLPTKHLSSLSLFSGSSSPLSTKSPKTYKPTCRVNTGIVKAEAMTTEKLGIKIERNPPESRLTQLGVKSWPKYVFCSFSSSFFHGKNWGKQQKKWCIHVFIHALGLSMGSCMWVIEYWTGGGVNQANSHGRSQPKRHVTCWRAKWRYTQMGLMSVLRLGLVIWWSFPKEWAALGMSLLQWTSITAWANSLVFCSPFASLLINNCMKWSIGVLEVDLRIQSNSYVCLSV